MAIQLDKVMIFCISIGFRILTVWYEAHFLHIHTFVGAKTHAGILAILYLATVYIFNYKRRRSQGLQIPILAVSTMMFVMGLLVSSRALKNTRKEVLNLKECDCRNSSCSNWIYPLRWYARWCYCLLLHHLRSTLSHAKVIYFLQTLTGDSFIVRSRFAVLKSVLIRI